MKRGPGTFPPTGQDVGYHTAMEYRFVRGDFARSRPGAGLDAHAPTARRG